MGKNNTRDEDVHSVSSKNNHFATHDGGAERTTPTPNTTMGKVKMARET